VVRPAGRVCAVVLRCAPLCAAVRLDATITPWTDAREDMGDSLHFIGTRPIRSFGYRHVQLSALRENDSFPVSLLLLFSKAEMIFRTVLIRGRSCNNQHFAYILSFLAGTENSPSLKIIYVFSKCSVKKCNSLDSKSLVCHEVFEIFIFKICDIVSLFRISENI